MSGDQRVYPLSSGVLSLWRGIVTAVVTAVLVGVLVGCGVSGDGNVAQSPADSSVKASNEDSGRSSADGSDGVAGDGRPVGHVGVWFDEEPEDRWEWLVWRSQKYVNDKITLPHLKENTVHPDHVGELDLCASTAVNRLKELGVVLDKTYGEHGRRCLYEIPIKGRIVATDRIAYAVQTDYLKSQQQETVKNIQKPDRLKFVTSDSAIGIGRCYVHDHKVNLSAFGYPDDIDATFDDICNAAVLSWQIFYNMFKI